MEVKDTDTRLAVYGSLAPGKVNHHQLSDLAGTWREGTVRGTLIDSGWGASIGFPGLILDPQGPAVSVQLFESPELPSHWARVDQFEGEGYHRVQAQVQTAQGEVTAWIYVVASEKNSAQ